MLHATSSRGQLKLQIMAFVTIVAITFAFVPHLPITPRQERSIRVTNSKSSIFVGNNNSGDDSVWDSLCRNFQGDFDNYNQVVEDRGNGLLPREGGGHENIHCTLIPLSETTRLAAFYFNGQPDKIFRFRYYELIPPSASSVDESSKSPIDMFLYTLHPELLKLLKERSEFPWEWQQIYSSFSEMEQNQPTLTLLEKCEVRWSIDTDPVEHSYLDDFDEKRYAGSVHAIMIHGEAVVDSQMAPGQKIRIVDQLSLFDDVFYINDRGFDPQSGAFIYGNQRDIPYRLERVSAWCADEENDKRRKIVDDSLSWTLGDKMRSESEYEENMKVIGGSSQHSR